MSGAGLGYASGKEPNINLEPCRLGQRGGEEKHAEKAGAKEAEAEGEGGCHSRNFTLSEARRTEKKSRLHTGVSPKRAKGLDEKGARGTPPLCLCYDAEEKSERKRFNQSKAPVPLTGLSIAHAMGPPPSRQKIQCRERINRWCGKKREKMTLFEVELPGSASPRFLTSKAQ